MSLSAPPDPPADHGAPARYRIRHSSAYRYGSDIVLAHHSLHLSPRAAPRQTVLSFHMDIDPPPSVISGHEDFFGNPTVYLEMHDPHSRLNIETEIVIEVEEPAAITQAINPPWETLRDRLRQQEGAAVARASAFAYASAMIPITPELQDYALPSFPAGRGIADAALDLTRRVHSDFTFDSQATTITTPVAEVLTARRGVCQDFAHLQIGCLRALGLSARYMSGYLRTVPPPGKPRLVGVDASHAWLSLWCGDDSWLDLDPTNGRSASSDMIALAWGRDYDDVSPIRGVILGSSIQHLYVSVDVATDDTDVAKAEVAVEDAR